MLLSRSRQFRTTRLFHSTPVRFTGGYSVGSGTKPASLILVDKKEGVGWITLNRPKELNALNVQVQDEVISTLEDFDKDPHVRCIVITGSKKAFAAGADIKEMADKTYMDVYNKNMFAGWDKFKKIRKPIIAAVNGYALGGGCELAMYCDMIIAGDTAKFGQPEITLGTIPGMGGTQRLTRAVGKSKAMEWVLTGEFFDAATAEKAGLVSRVVPADDLLAEAEKLAKKIGKMSLPISMMAKHCVNKAFESTLEEGVALERTIFHSTFATKDKMEGMAAFVAKRSPTWKDE